MALTVVRCYGISPGLCPILLISGYRSPAGGCRSRRAGKAWDCGMVPGLVDVGRRPEYIPPTIPVVRTCVILFLGP